MKSNIDINHKIDEAFEPYQPTAPLLSQFLSARTNIQEFILLACARLDSLSNIAFSEGSQQETFAKFLLRYSGLKDWFTCVSVPDLYYHLSYHLWRLPGTVDKPGRLHLLDPREDKEIMTIFWKSELGITERDLGNLLRFILRTLRSWYRAVPNQSLSKSTYDTPQHLTHQLSKLSEGYHRGAYYPSMKAISPLVSKFSLAALLYREYRCGAIHKYHVKLSDKDFFTHKEPYWCPFYNDFFEPGRFLKLHFPGLFLLRTLENCIQNYKKHLRAKRQLPAEIFFELCDTMKDLKFLDDDSIPPSRDLNVSL